MSNEETPAVDMAMSPEEFAELRAQAAALGQQDVLLGRLLNALVLHLGHAHGLDPVQEDARLAALAKEAEDAAAAKAEEDAKAAEAAPVAAAEGADNAS